MTGQAEDLLEGLSDEQLTRIVLLLEVKRSNAMLNELFPRRGGHRDVHDMTSEELSFEILEGLALAEPDESLSTLIREHACEYCEHKRKYRELRDHRPSREDVDDPGLTDDLEIYIAILMADMLGRFHDKVTDPALILERYRGRFPDHVLAGAYYRVCHSPYSAYSIAVRAKLERFAGLQDAA